MTGVKSFDGCSHCDEKCVRNASAGAREVRE